MHTTTPASLPAADQQWAGFAALRLLDEAEGALHALSGEVSRLVDDAGWRNRGTSVLSLQKLLGEVAKAIRREVAAIGDQRAVVRAGMNL